MNENIIFQKIETTSGLEPTFNLWSNTTMAADRPEAPTLYPWLQPKYQKLLKPPIYTLYGETPWIRYVESPLSAI